MVAIEKPYFMENDGWWFTDEAGQARISPDSYEAFMEDFESFVSGVVFREG